MTERPQDEEQQAFADLSPDHILDAIDSLGYSTSGRLLALNSYENRVYQIGLEDDSPIVAKFYRPGRWSNDAIHEEHEFSQELATQGVPVVPPLVKNDQTLHQFGPYRFAVYPSYGGHTPELDNPEHLEQLGRFVGRIHSIGRQKPFEHRPTLDIQSFGHEPRAYLLDSSFLPDHVRHNYEQVSAQLLGLIEQTFSGAINIENIRLHGDLHPGNILTRDEVFHIVDLDDARTGPAIQDLWMLLSGDRSERTIGLMDVLEGYEQFCSFNTAELNLIEALRSLRLIHYAYWLAKRWHDPAFPLAFPWFNSVGFWEEHVQQLREQLFAMEEEPLRLFPA
jgi:Ser/Thr protein kinase RdoA (MazF antagonist)